ncbi:TniQ family protein [Paenibacillus sp. GD4]|uniref:TniQ family protein n=1 Tax=Paenibacillus sp. GD4 TaxID=3068890 RepID=UPI00279662CF|nr:TniQ family protein [Paenibacillus sp. GD4]MDQ1914760.1 TniQ family protein [Paenibacillus sp. GD4]
MVTLAKRPKLFSEESFTSYLMRISNMNHTSSMEVCKLISNQNKVRYMWKYDLDLTNLIDQEKVQQLFGKTANELGTFSIIKDKLLEKYDMGLNYFVGNLLEKNGKYCPICIQESLHYKILWQVKDIKICDVHEISLLNICGICLMKLPYTHELLGLGICPNCNNSLTNKCKHIDFFEIRNR